MLKAEVAAEPASHENSSEPDAIQEVPVGGLTGVLQLVFLACPKEARKQMKENWPVVGKLLSMKDI